MNDIFKDPYHVTKKFLELLPNKRFSGVATNNFSHSSNTITLYHDDEIRYVAKEVFKERVLLKDFCMHRVAGCVELHDDDYYCMQYNFKRAYVYIKKVSHMSHNKHFDYLSSPLFLTSPNIDNAIHIKEGALFKFDPRKPHGIISNHKIDMYVFWF